MASDEHDVQVKGRRRRRRAPETNDHSNDNGAPSGTPSTMRLLWADLRRQQLPRPLDAEELAWIEAEEEMRREAEQEAGRAHSITPDHVENLRRRYASGAS